MTQSTNMVRLQDSVRVAVPGALDGMIRMAMYNVLKEFFQRTNCWLLELPVFISPPSNDYVLNTGQNVVVNRLMGLGRPQTPPPVDLGTYAPMCPPQFLASVVTDTLPTRAEPAVSFATFRHSILMPERSARSCGST